MIVDRLIDLITECFGKDKESRENMAGGLAFGLAVGLTFGLAFGLVVGLGDFIIQASLSSSPLSILVFFAVLAVLFAEVLFWLDKKKPKLREAKWKFTIKRKLIALGESSYIISQIIGGCHLVVKGAPFLADFLGMHWQTIMSIIGWGTTVVVCLVGYVWLNSLKYRGVKK